MAKDNSGKQQQQLRQLIAQQAARMIAEEGISDYAFAKRKAARQLGVVDNRCLPGNAEIEQEVRAYQEIYLGEDQPEMLKLLRQSALEAMHLLEQFDPHLAGSVLEGTAGRYADTDIHLFADSDKDVEIFLLNQKIHYESSERSYRYGNERRKVPVFTLEGPHGNVRLSVFSPDEARQPPRSTIGNGVAARASTHEVQALLD